MKKKQEDRLFDDTCVSTTTGAKRPSHWILWISLLFLLIAVLYTSLTKIDEVTKAEGKVIPSKKIQIIQNLEGGIVRQINVKEGELVKQGEILINIDDTRFASAYHEGMAKEKALQLRAQRLSAEAEGKSFNPDKVLKQDYSAIVNSEQALYHSLINNLDNQINIIKDQREQKQQELAELSAKKKKLAKSFALISRELKLTSPLVEEGAVSEVEILRLKRQVNEVEGELAAVKLAIPKAKKVIDESDKKIQQAKLKFKSQALENLTKTHQELRQARESNKALADRFSRTAIKSPVDGTVKQIYVNTIGGVVKPGMELMEIVPNDDSLLVEAKVKPADIGFIHPGQDAMVKLTAYDFSIYGGLPGIVEHISADTSMDDKGESYYEIRVRTKATTLEHNDKHYPIIPGMMASVDILTGEKSIMDYILKPILKTKQGALHEK